MNGKIKAARIALGEFLADRRKQMGRTQQELATFLAITSNTVNGVETGRFACDIDLLLRFCQALELKPFFAPLEEISAIETLDKASIQPRFLLAPDHKARELYILHREYPACLIQVIQTTPVTFRIVDIYDNIEPEELAAHPFMQEAKKFWRSYNEKPEN